MEKTVCESSPSSLWHYSSEIRLDTTKNKMKFLQLHLCKDSPSLLGLSAQTIPLQLKWDYSHAWC